MLKHIYIKTLTPILTIHKSGIACFMKYNLSIVFFLLLMGLGLSVVSCGDSDDTSKDPGLVTLKLKVDVDDQQPVSRNTGTPIGGEAAENEIKKLKVFAFNGAGTTLEAYASIEISNGTSSDPMWDATQGALRVVLTPGAKKIYCIANWEDNTSKGMPVLDNTTITSSTALESTLRTHTNFELSNPPVMSGALSKTLTGAEESEKVNLTRQIARVEVYPLISDFLSYRNVSVELKGVRFASLAGTAYLFGKRANPSSFSTWGPTAVSIINPAFSITETVKASATRCGDFYYIPENMVTTATNAIWMILEVAYNGATRYYSLYVNTSGDGNHSAYAVERNHTYRLYVTIQGEGATTLPTTVTRTVSESGNQHNLTCEVEIN